MTRKHLFLCGMALTLLTTAQPGQATLVSYFLDQTNIDDAPPGDFGDGVNYLRVDIDDGDGTGDVNFTVTVLGSLTPFTGGIASFGFNLTGPEIAGYSEININEDSILVDSNPTTDWSVNSNATAPPNNEDGFGRFDMVVRNTGDTTRAANTLSFAVSGFLTDTVLNYFELALAEDGTTVPEQGSFAFVARVAGFEGASAGSGYFGGSTVVPLPAAVWMLLSGIGVLTTFARRKRHSSAVVA